MYVMNKNFLFYEISLIDSVQFFWITDVLCLPLQDDHEITIEELEMRYNTSVSKVRYLLYWFIYLFSPHITACYPLCEDS